MASEFVIYFCLALANTNIAGSLTFFPENGFNVAANFNYINTNKLQICGKNT